MKDLGEDGTETSVTKEAPSCDQSSSRGMANVQCSGCPSFAFVGKPLFAAEAQGFVQPQSCDYFTGYLLHFEELDREETGHPDSAHVFPKLFLGQHGGPEGSL